MSIKLTPEQQGNIIEYVRSSIELNYKPNSSEYRRLMTDVYQALSTFEMPDTGDVMPRFKVNKAHEIVNKVTPRVFAKSPKFQVTSRTDAFFKQDNTLVGEDRQTALQRNQKMAKAVQDYLNVLFEDQDLQESLKLWVKNQIVYGNAFAQVIPKYVIQRAKGRSQKVEEKMVSTLPTIDVISWTEMFYDPRYKKLKDMPGIARVRDGVRLQDLYFAKNDKGQKKYFNLDKIETLSGTANEDDMDSYKQQIYSITGVSNITSPQAIDKNSLNLQVFEGKYSVTGKPEDERLYEITIVNYGLLIGFEEITQLSYVDIKAHEDVELFFSTGFVAPIMGIQDELNFQKNAQALAISKALNRSYLWSPDSGVDPAQLITDKPGNIIVCPDGVEKAQRGLQEVVNNPLPSQYFNNINDYNRDINNLTHTTDVSGQAGQTAQINTATGAKIAFFESNAVIAEVRKNFERGARELGYKLLQWTVDNIEDNIILKKSDEDKFIEINIEALRDALDRYEIRVEAGSSSFDEQETRINEALAVKNLMLEWANAGGNVNLDEGFKAILSNFESVIDPSILVKQEDPFALLAQQAQQTGRPSDTGQQTPTTPQQLTEDVAQGGLTEGII